MKKIQVLLYTAMLVLAAGCAGCNTSGEVEKVPGKSNSITIMTWNVQALFDGVEDGHEYDDYRESSGWSREKYQGRLNVIAGAVGGMSRKPDIIALQEIESARVIADLAGTLSAHGYRWTHFANMPGMSLGVGLISRFPIDAARSHSAACNGETAPRPVLELRINTTPAGTGNSGAESLAVFICHWKSKLGGDDATEGLRRASARIILRRIRELERNDPNLPVIVTGDLNENYDEFYRRGGKGISALLPDDLRAAEYTGLYGLDTDSDDIVNTIDKLQNDFIVVSKTKPPAARYFPGGVTSLYSPWTEELQNGTYYYKNDWETIDHFLLSARLFDGNGWDFENCTALNTPPFSNAKGQPAAYNPRTGSGLSDHFPLLLLLQWK